MPYPWIKAVHFIGLALLLGGPVFWQFIDNSDRKRPGPASTTGWLLFAVGLVLFLVSGYLDAVRAARDLWGELLPGDMRYFLTESRYGVIVARKSMLAVVFAVVGRSGSRPGLGAAWWRCWAWALSTTSA